MRLAQALGLGPDEIGFGTHRPGLWQGGPRFLYAPVANLDALARARPIEPAWSEDPATGSASAILAAQLLVSGALAAGETRLTLHQGVEMGRASVIGLTAVVAASNLAEVRIAGSAVPVSEGRIRVP